jgi:hypothetical protein
VAVSEEISGGLVCRNQREWTSGSQVEEHIYPILPGFHVDTATRLLIRTRLKAAAVSSTQSRLRPTPR